MKIYRQPEVTKLTGIPRSSLHLLIKQGRFPKPIKLGVRSVGWIEQELDAWLKERKELRT
jgi:prophage regulatory protein